jgi:phosphate transport system substrate-binding protein
MTRAGLAATALAAAALGTAAPVSAAPPITMSGEPVTRALVADLAYFYRHQTRRPPLFELNGGGSSAGIADTVRGITDAALVSRPLSAQDPPGLTIHRLAISAICLVAHARNPVPALTRAQVQDIVAGRVSAWSQIPGSARTGPIVPVDLGLTSGAGRVFQDVFLDPGTAPAWRPVTLLTTAQARDYIQQDPDAFGYVDLALTGPLHTTAYEGVDCTRAAVRAGRYRASRPLAVVTRGRPRPALRRFLRWVRHSRTARRVIATRYIPTARTTSRPTSSP